MSKYSDYVLTKARRCEVNYISKQNSFLVNQKYNVILNNKSKRWMCTCKFYSDGKCKEVYCSHILGVFLKFDWYAWKKEVENV